MTIDAFTNSGTCIESYTDVTEWYTNNDTEQYTNSDTEWYTNSVIEWYIDSDTEWYTNNDTEWYTNSQGWGQAHQCLYVKCFKHIF